MVVAVEPSADAIGAALVLALKDVAPPGAEFSGVGGPMMAAAGISSLFPFERLAVMGLTDALRAFPEALRRADEIALFAASEKIDAAIFVDAWAFSKIAAGRLRKIAPQTKIFKFAAPQVWASRAHRVNEVKKNFDGVLCLLPFEPPYFEKAGVPAAFIGNPNFQAAFAARGDAADFRRRHALGEAPLLAVLPGSRRGEIRAHLKPFGEAVRILVSRLPSLRVVTALPAPVAPLAEPVIRTWPGGPIFATPEEKADAFAAADAALAKSGTVTTELAANGVAMVVAYKVDPLTALWARMIVTTKYATILNVVAGRQLIPEHIQGNCRPERLAADVLALLTDRELRLEQIELFPSLLARLGVDGAPAGELGARKIAEWMNWAGPVGA
jgi:lipid-A-disaccharide synthase